MYIITFYQNGENCTPLVFSDKLTAYKQWAKALICQALEYEIIDTLYLPSVDIIKDFTDCLKLRTFIDDIFREKENVYTVANGYALCCNDDLETVIQKFEIEINEGEHL